MCVLDTEVCAFWTQKVCVLDSEVMPTPKYSVRTQTWTQLAVTWRGRGRDTSSKHRITVDISNAIDTHTAIALGDTHTNTHPHMSYIQLLQL